MPRVQVRIGAASSSAIEVKRATKRLTQSLKATPVAFRKARREITGGRWSTTVLLMSCPKVIAQADALSKIDISIHNRCFVQGQSIFDGSGVFGSFSAERMLKPGMITSAQCRAARALLDWSQQALADAASVGVVTIRQFEGGGAEPRHSTRDVIKRALEGAGVDFIPENGGGPGVRLKRVAPERDAALRPIGPATDVVDAMDAAIGRDRKKR